MSERSYCFQVSELKILLCTCGRQMIGSQADFEITNYRQMIGSRAYFEITNYR